MKECQWTRKICKELEGLGCEIYPLTASMYGKMHWPDRLIIHRDVMCLVEFKGVKTELRLGQKLLIDRLNGKRPGAAYVARQALNGQHTLNDRHVWTTARGLLESLTALQKAVGN